ncbi:hypothetical protein EMIT0P100_10202 [Pseudomonas sp. IT-P100]
MVAGTHCAGGLDDSGVTTRATYVHKCLRDSYIDALFRRILLAGLGINPAKPLVQAYFDPMNVADRPSDFEPLQGDHGCQLTPAR